MFVGGKSKLAVVKRGKSKFETIVALKNIDAGKQYSVEVKALLTKANSFREAVEMKIETIGYHEKCQTWKTGTAR